MPFPSPRDLPDPGIEPGSPALEADALTSEPPGKQFAWFLKKKKKPSMVCLLISLRNIAGEKDVEIVYCVLKLLACLIVPSKEAFNLKIFITKDLSGYLHECVQLNISNTVYQCSFY